MLLRSNTASACIFEYSIATSKPLEDTPLPFPGFSNNNMADA